MKAQRASSHPKHTLRNVIKKAKNPKWHGHNKSLLSDDHKQSLSLTSARYENQMGHSGKSSLKSQRRQYAKAVSGRTVSSPLTAAPRVKALAAHINGQTKSLSNSGDSDTEDSQGWRSYAQSVLQNGKQTIPDAEESLLSEHVGEEIEPFLTQFDHTNNRTLMVMRPGQTLCFRGKCLLTCLYGRVEVLGFTIEEGQQPYPLYSPASHCPLTITALADSSLSTKNRKEGRQEAKMVVRKYLSSVPRKHLLNEMDSDSCVVLLEALDNPLTRFLTSHSQLNELFGLSSKELRSDSAVDNSALSAVGLMALNSSGNQGLITSRSYRDALHRLVQVWGDDECDRCPIILVYGAKNSGKSTFVRHLINSLLNQTTSVEYLECDVGQTEFTPPGCLSLTAVTEPLLGPPFTHQQEPRHMVYYGQADCQSDLDRYLESLKSLWRHSSGDMPVIINTMGWVRGLGFQLLVDLVRFFSVTHVVQLSFGETSQCPALTPEFLRTAHGWQTHPPAQPALGQPENQEAPHSHVFLSIHSEFEGAGSSGEMRHQRSNELRDLALMGYFSQMQAPDSSLIRPLHCFTPYQVSLSAVAIGVTHCDVAPTHILYAANASLVGLCCLDEKVVGRGGPMLLSQTPICPCVGLGVLRGVDMIRGLYLLVTPVHPTLLSRVNCLLLGEISLPKALLTIQSGVEGDLPYITTDYSFELTGAGKLHIFKGLSRPSFVRSKTSSKV
ncbi:polynucleotide 5'-hydroxyl-kinase NOL9 isoform X1 [Alosa sapidissima]|uniref:polynucleotide 5'-hydroxyl-kinase NOL9 isoform X1 n=1 Tax=Alosa sapidissima TaxID=34773 RepID=UPI001C088567|nr:polynucleotide 5'-hydroxyl-kinase NOL9 isoform X1 [Alosa sapidissima]XP_041955050.1 polynucleotide 5'-hydroxyl-kinase NOL9 isoform X1 [Alosa sapidissima]XP_041955051.1 polynucleotide 5'-hydroxyl-kinase NOL9 isoform X1 [Alosa sapidissima]